MRRLFALLPILFACSLDALSAQVTADDLRTSFLALNTELAIVIPTLESIDDVDSAATRIARLHDRFVQQLGSSTNSAKTTNEFALLLQSDEDMAASVDRVQLAIADLEEQNPEASAHLELLLQVQARRSMDALVGAGHADYAEGAEPD